MEFPILALRPPPSTTTLVKDGKEERAVVQSTVLDRIVQLGHLETKNLEGAGVEGPDAIHP